MKNLTFRMVLGFAFLLTLVGLSGGGSLLTAHAAAPHRSSCTSDTFRITADNEKNTDCFTGTGTINVRIYNATVVCTGIYRASITFKNDGQSESRSDFGPHTCYTLSKINKVLSIRLVTNPSNPSGIIPRPTPNVP